MALTDLEVGGVVRGGHLQEAGAEVPLDVLVGDDRQVASHQRQDRRASDQLAVALVVGVDRHRGVPQHRLRAHRRDRHRAPTLEVVADRVQRVGLAALLDLQVGDRRARAGVPVDDVPVAVDEALLVERHEHLHDRAVVALVEREALFGVVARGPQPLELLDDRVPVVLAPLPRPAHELLAPELLAARALGAQRLLDLRLRGDARVVGTKDPLRPLAVPSGGSGSSASCIEPFNAWPMCSEPVTFGGGIAIE